jgi:hypothetical protein
VTEAKNDLTVATEWLADSYLLTSSPASAMQLETCSLERRADGAVIVRVPSRSKGATALPDAVFSFRAGDPQYDYWERQFRLRQTTDPVPGIG